MKKVIAYIDGYNLYYGLLQGTGYKWLDLVAFVRKFLREDQELVGVKYFTAQIKTHPHDEAAIDRQILYLRALATLPLVKTIYGFYSKHDSLAPANEKKCLGCEVSGGTGLVPIVKLEEKRSDVNMAVEFVMDAVNNEADSFFLFTGDSDQVGAIDVVRGRLGKSVCVFNPHEGFSVKLKTAASYYQNIPRDLPRECLLPLEVPYGKKGKFISCPEAWRP